MQNNQKHYFKKVEKLSYKEYLQLVVFFCKFYNNVKENTDKIYYIIIDKRNSKF